MLQHVSGYETQGKRSRPRAGGAAGASGIMDLQDFEEEGVYKQKVTMKRWILIWVGVLTLAACTKQGLVDAEALTGTWSEVYDPTVLAFEASSVYTFKADGTAHRRIRDYEVNASHEIDLLWRLKRNELTLTFPNGHEDHYTVTLSGRDEMSWQRVGTTYSKGTWGIDWIHLLRAE